LNGGIRSLFHPCIAAILAPHWVLFFAVGSLGDFSMADIQPHKRVPFWRFVNRARVLFQCLYWIAALGVLLFALLHTH
jgi:hypothetical protein